MTHNTGIIFREQSYGNSQYLKIESLTIYKKKKKKNVSVVLHTICLSSESTVVDARELVEGENRSLKSLTTLEIAR